MTTLLPTLYDSGIPTSAHRFSAAAGIRRSVRYSGDTDGYAQQWNFNYSAADWT